MKRRYFIISRLIAALLILLYIIVFQKINVVPFVLVLVALFSADYFVKVNNLLLPSDPKNNIK